MDTADPDRWHWRRAGGEACSVLVLLAFTIFSTVANGQSQIDGALLSAALSGYGTMIRLQAFQRGIIALTGEENEDFVKYLVNTANHT